MLLEPISGGSIGSCELSVQRHTTEDEPSTVTCHLVRQYKTSSQWDVICKQGRPAATHPGTHMMQLRSYSSGPKPQCMTHKPRLVEGAAGVLAAVAALSIIRHCRLIVF